MRWVPSTPHDIRELAKRSAYGKVALQANLEAQRDWLEEYARTGFMYGQRIAALGVSPMHGGVAEAWAILTPEAHAHSFAIAREAKRLLAIAETMFNRVQATRTVDDPMLMRWFDFLGFETEGRLRAWGTEGEDVFMASRIR